MSKLVNAWDTRTGKPRQVPVHWFDHEDLSANLTRTDPKIPQVAPEGVNQVARPDDRDYATAEEVAGAAAAAGELKGKALDAELEKAGLPKTGSADEKRAALAEKVERDEAVAEIDRLNAASIASGKGPVIEITEGDTVEDLKGLIELATSDTPTDSNTGDHNTEAPPAGDK